jgi:hypothetical protein
MTTPLPPGVADMFQPGCGCADCQSAVSPGAYLATLLDYTIKNVQDGDTPISTDFLTQRFHQPFGGLPLDCSGAEDPVAQVRIAVEVLRGYLGVRPLLETGREDVLAAGEAAYRLAAYVALLTGAGTSFAEIRRATTASASDRSALAGRLGITLTAGPPGATHDDELDKLWRDPQLAVDQPSALTEEFLDRAFGLAGTDGDPLTVGLKTDDAAQQFTGWRFTGVDAGRNTDADGTVYLSVAHAAGYVVSVFADAGRTSLVATGVRADPTGPVRLSPVAGSALSGEVQLAYSVDAADTKIAVAPLLLCWRLAALRSSWQAEDWPAGGPPPNGTDELAPLVDPDTIGLADLRSTRPGNPAYDVWLARVKELADRREALAQAGAAAAGPVAAFDAVIALALSVAGDAVTTGRLDDLAAAEQRGETITSGLAALGLTAPAYRYLMPLLDLARAGQQMSDGEWNLVLDTLVVTRKRRDIAVWRAAEQAAGITLSPNYFRAASDDSAPARARDIDTPVWLSTHEARRRWSEVLAARIEQETNITAGVDSARNAAEEAALPLLRDILVANSDAEGDDVSSRAEWLTRLLLVDMRMAATHRTTRVAQGLETLQELLFRLRTGQFYTDNPQPKLLTSVRVAPTADGRTHLLGSDDQATLWHRVWDGQWRSWRSRGQLPGATSFGSPSEVGVAVRGNGFDVGVIGGDECLWVRRFENGWTAWQKVPGSVQLSGSPGLAVRGPNDLDVFVHRATDSEIVRHHFDGASWSGPDDVGATSARSPAAVSRTPGTVDLILAHSVPILFQPFHRYWDGATWHNEDLDDRLDSDVALIAPSAGGLQVYENRLGSLYRKVLDGAAWQPWENVDVGITPVGPPWGTPAACEPTPGTVDVYNIRKEGAKPTLCRRRLSEGQWSVWEKLPSEDLQLDNLQFDAEWVWLGSYATYRSAALVRLYPDFLLLPSLAAFQTPAFRSLSAQSRPTQPISPLRARQLAQQYSDYLGDVVNLDVQATCQGRTPVDGGPSGLTWRSVHYLFGRAYPEGRVYWCMFDPRDDHTGYAQSFWDEIPVAAGDGKPAKFRVRRIIGALPWNDDLADRHHIYLFLETEDWSGRKLQRAAFDTNQMAWEPGVQEITGDFPLAFGSKPATMYDMELVVVQSDTSSGSPRLAVHPWGSSQAYLRPLNHDVTGFVPSAGDWADFAHPTLGVSTLYAALRTGSSGTNWIVYRDGDSITAGSDIPDANPLISTRLAMTVGDPGSTFLGALPNNNGAIFVFTHQDGDHRYQQTFARGRGPGKVFLFSSDSTALVPHSGGSPEFFVTEENSDHTYAHTCGLAVDKLVGKSRFDVVPLMRWVTDIPDGGTVSDLQSRRLSVQNVYADNATASESILTYLREAYRLVPQQLALALQASAEYVAALDWFATVYDYRARLSDRCIDYGLALDAQLPPASVLKWPQGWLLDPLNPHAIARTRRGATLRYAVSAIISCLNASADADFSFDTSESLVRARVQYDTALRLCDVPELRQDLPDCTALIGMLSITPGEAVPPEVAAALGAAAEELTQAPKLFTSHLNDIVRQVMVAKIGALDWDAVLPLVDAFKLQTLATAVAPMNADTVIAASSKARVSAHAALLTNAAVEDAARRVGVLGSALTTSEAL